MFFGKNKVAKRVFISFISGNRISEVTATALHSLLVHGASLDPDLIFQFQLGGPEVGENVFSSIRQGLRSCKIGFTICTEETHLKPWVMFESGGIWTRERPVIPIVVPPLRPEQLFPALRDLLVVRTNLSSDVRKMYERLREVLPSIRDIPGRWNSAAAAFHDQIKNLGQIVTRPWLDTRDILHRLKITKKGLRIWTTWTPFLCTANELPPLPNRRVPGVYDELKAILLERANNRHGLELEILLLSPASALASRRSRELHGSDSKDSLQYNMMFANFKNALDLCATLRNSHVRVTVKYSDSWPAFSYHQVEHFVDIGFFPPGQDAAESTRILFRDEQVADDTSIGRPIVEVFNTGWEYDATPLDKAAPLFTQLRGAWEGPNDQANTAAQHR